MINEVSELKLKQMIGKMFIVGFDSLDIKKNDEIYKAIKEYNLGGVILFDKYFYDRAKSKNIQNPLQVKELTTKLQKISKNKLIISIDQEGGKVQRLKKSDGFKGSISAKKISKLSKDEAKKIYFELSDELQKLGINTNFAPLVDLAINDKNDVIYQLERSYGSDPKEVIKYAEIFMDELHKHKILSVLKHFPGHGSSFGDSHKGFVDVSDTYKEIELEPFNKLVHKAKMVMSAHVFNKKIDDKYPATLSYKTNTQILRNKLQYDGVIVSDDMQMKAIDEHYSKKEAIKLSINSGVDMVIFGNQLSSDNPLELIELTYELVKNNDISFSRIEEANVRIDKLMSEI